MIIGNLDLQIDIDNCIETHDLFIGISAEEGIAECCGNRVIVVRFGFLFFTINILIQEANHKH